MRRTLVCTLGLTMSKFTTKCFGESNTVDYRMYFCMLWLHLYHQVRPITMIVDILINLNFMLKNLNIPYDIWFFICWKSISFDSAYVRHALSDCISFVYIYSQLRMIIQSHLSTTSLSMTTLRMSSTWLLKYLDGPTPKWRFARSYP